MTLLSIISVFKVYLVRRSFLFILWKS